jgi:hypothetical protein
MDIKDRCIKEKTGCIELNKRKNIKEDKKALVVE